MPDRIRVTRKQESIGRICELVGREERKMTFYLNDEPIRRADDVELDGVDVSDLKVWQDETFTTEVDTSGWTADMWRDVFGLIPIIRCRDCRFFSEDWRCLTWHQHTVEHGYCYRAERRPKDVQEH